MEYKPSPPAILGPDFGYYPVDVCRCAICHAPARDFKHLEDICSTCGHDQYNDEYEHRPQQCPNCKTVDPDTYWITVWRLGENATNEKSDYEFEREMRADMNMAVGMFLKNTVQRHQFALENEFLNGPGPPIEGKADD